MYASIFKYIINRIYTHAHIGQQVLQQITSAVAVMTRSTC